MAQRGGKRPGAGRKKGSRNRATVAQRMSISELAQSHAEVAMKTLAEIAAKGESETARVSAANAILDRGFGKPPQAHQHTGRGGGPIETVNLSKLSADELTALESVFGRLAGPGDDAGVDPAREGETRH